jgi:hypothetical protein
VRTYVLAGALALGGLLACSGHCCNDGDCWGNDICSADCASGQPQGICLQRCQVDLDCSEGDVCDDFRGSCACDAPADAGAPGTCPQGANGG